MNILYKHWCIAICLFVVTGTVAAQDTGLCGSPFTNSRGIGPFDYLDGGDRTNPLNIPTLEKHHFNLNVQMGRRGQSSANVMQDLDFILRACPNHHPALYSLIKYQLKNKPVVPSSESVECYLDRATRFNPQDGTAHMLAGIYYARIDSDERALEAYLEALKYIPDSIELNYNLGLHYLTMGNYTAANEHAVRAYQLGAQLPGLKKKLVRLDAWNPDVAQAQVSDEASDVE